MIVNPNALFLLIILIVILSILVCLLYTRHLKDERERDMIYNRIKRKYIRATPMLYNAILEAYEQACTNKNEFQEKAYNKLMQEVKEKW